MMLSTHSNFEMHWSDYERFMLTLVGLVLLVGIGHIVSYFAMRYAEQHRQKERRVFWMRTQRYLASYWAMMVIAAMTAVFGMTGAIVVGVVVSFVALREFVTLTPVKSGDHRAISIAFFVVLPAQYVLIGYGQYGLFTVLIPVYAFLLLPIISMLQQDTDRFLTRKASLQWGLMIAVYCLSHVVAILNIDLVADYDKGRRALFLLYFLVLVRTVALAQHGADYYCRHGSKRIAAAISQRFTWNGMMISAAVAAIVAASFVSLTPLRLWQALVAGSLIAVSSIMGRLVMRSIALSMGIRDWGEVTGREQGVLDRMDGLLFAAPVFFHFVQFVVG